MTIFQSFLFQKVIEKVISVFISEERQNFFIWLDLMLSKNSSAIFHKFTGPPGPVLVNFYWTKQYLNWTLSSGPVLLLNPVS
jgi:hypothetical protein